MMVQVSRKSSKSRTLPKNFVSCVAYSKKRWDEVELWIPEGLSASGGIVSARDSEFQAILPIRGKSLNFYKASPETILNNRESSDLIQVLGAGVDFSAGLGDDAYNMFDIEKLRCNKIIIASDADSDGFHIRMLIVVLLSRMCPEVIRRGMVYVAEAPIYKIEWAGGNEKFFYNQHERDQFMRESGITSFTESRYKGLGTFDPSELRETMVRPGSRRLRQIQFDPHSEDILGAYYTLFGSDTAARREAVLMSLLNDGVDYDDFMEDVRALDIEALSEDITDVRETISISY